MSRARIVVAAALALACAEPERRDAADAAATATASPAMAEATPPRAYGANHFRFGASATRAQVAAWNRDIGPDGLELPAGRGSARDGATIYRAQCAACHGAEGQGLAPLYPALIGRDPRGEDFGFALEPSIPRTIGNYWSHATTLYDYIRRAMPLYTPGSLNADETYAVTAYLLAANRVIPDSAVLDAAALRAVRMPARDRFTSDNRSPTRP